MFTSHIRKSVTQTLNTHSRRHPLQSESIDAGDENALLQLGRLGVLPKNAGKSSESLTSGDEVFMEIDDSDDDGAQKKDSNKTGDKRKGKNPFQPLKKGKLHALRQKSVDASNILGELRTPSKSSVSDNDGGDEHSNCESNESISDEPKKNVEFKMEKKKTGKINKDKFSVFGELTTDKTPKHLEKRKGKTTPDVDLVSWMKDKKEVTSLGKPSAIKAEDAKAKEKNAKFTKTKNDKTTKEGSVSLITRDVECKGYTLEGMTETVIEDTTEEEIMVIETITTTDIGPLMLNGMEEANRKRGNDNTNIGIKSSLKEVSEGSEISIKQQGKDDGGNKHQSTPLVLKMNLEAKQNVKVTIPIHEETGNKVSAAKAESVSSSEKIKVGTGKKEKKTTPFIMKKKRSNESFSVQSKITTKTLDDKDAIPFVLQTKRNEKVNEKAPIPDISLNGENALTTKAADMTESGDGTIKSPDKDPRNAQIQSKPFSLNATKTTTDNEGKNDPLKNLQSKPFALNPQVSKGSKDDNSATIIPQSVRRSVSRESAELTPSEEEGTPSASPSPSKGMWKSFKRTDRNKKEDNVEKIETAEDKKRRFKDSRSMSTAVTSKFQEEKKSIADSSAADKTATRPKLTRSLTEIGRQDSLESLKEEMNEIIKQRAWKNETDRKSKNKLSKMLVKTKAPWKSYEAEPGQLDYDKYYKMKERHKEKMKEKRLKEIETGSLDMDKFNGIEKHDENQEQMDMAIQERERKKEQIKEKRRKQKLQREEEELLKLQQEGNDPAKCEKVSSEASHIDTRQDDQILRKDIQENVEKENNVISQESILQKEKTIDQSPKIPAEEPIQKDLLPKRQEKVEETVIENMETTEQLSENYEENNEPLMPKEENVHSEMKQPSVVKRKKEPVTKHMIGESNVEYDVLQAPTKENNSVVEETNKNEKEPVIKKSKTIEKLSENLSIRSEEKIEDRKSEKKENAISIRSEKIIEERKSEKKENAISIRSEKRIEERKVLKEKGVTNEEPNIQKDETIEKSLEKPIETDELMKEKLPEKTGETKAAIERKDRIRKLLDEKKEKKQIEESTENLKLSRRDRINKLIGKTKENEEPEKVEKSKLVNKVINERVKMRDEINDESLTLKDKKIEKSPENPKEIKKTTEVDTLPNKKTGENKKPIIGGEKDFITAERIETVNLKKGPTIESVNRKEYKEPEKDNSSPATHLDEVKTNQSTKVQIDSSKKEVKPIDIPTTTNVEFFKPSPLSKYSDEELRCIGPKAPLKGSMTENEMKRKFFRASGDPYGRYTKSEILERHDSVDDINLSKDEWVENVINKICVRVGEDLPPYLNKTEDGKWKRFAAGEHVYGKNAPTKIDMESTTVELKKSKMDNIHDEAWILVARGVKRRSSNTEFQVDEGDNDDAEKWFSIVQGSEFSDNKENGLRLLSLWSKYRNMTDGQLWDEDNMPIQRKEFIRFDKKYQKEKVTK